MLPQSLQLFILWIDLTPCPSFHVWQVDTSKGAMDSQLRRICTPKPASGKLEVSPEIYGQWKAGGAQRKLLLDQLIKCNGDKEIHGFSHYGHKYALIQAHDVVLLCAYNSTNGQPCWRSSSKSTLSTCRKSLAETISMWRRGSTRRRRWKQTWVGLSHVLSHVESCWIYYMSSIFQYKMWGCRP